MSEDRFLKELEMMAGTVKSVEGEYQVPRDVLIAILSDYLGVTEGAVNRITREMSQGHARMDHVAKRIMNLKRDGIIK
jgi:hypothetical protein